jgi:hypothetical protein
MNQTIDVHFDYEVIFQLGFAQFFREQEVE